jgi:hypothetical protein
VSWRSYHSSTPGWSTYLSSNMEQNQYGSSSNIICKMKYMLHFIAQSHNFCNRIFWKSRAMLLPIMHIQMYTVFSLWSDCLFLKLHDFFPQCYELSFTLCLYLPVWSGQNWLTKSRLCLCNCFTPKITILNRFPCSLIPENSF